MKDIISAVDLKAQILARSELAILDVREEGIYFEGHLLWASNTPLSRLEFVVGALLPCLVVPIVVYDSGPVGKEGVARRAQSRLQELEFENVQILSGGIDGWREAGFEIFSGLNVPSKTFGEYLLQNRKPPEIKALDLHKRLTQNDNLVVLDSRPMDEYNAMSIPSAIDVPGAELVYRIFEVAADHETDVVVNCAGRTRSIVGAMSLINAEVPNRVMLLKDGTMGWHLAGLALDNGKSQVVPEPSKDNFIKSRKAAERVKEKFDVQFVGWSEFVSWQQDKTRTLYVFDVRSNEEYESGHLVGSRHAPGGQLVQTTDEFVAVRNSRIVLVDDKEVRAIMTASWLKQMGHREIFVLKEPFVGAKLENGWPIPTFPAFEKTETLDPDELRAVLQSGEPVMLVDLSTSRNFRIGHIDGAYWCIRQRLEPSLVWHKPIGLLILTSEDSVLAHYASGDMAKSDPSLLVRVLEGGNQAWRAAGYELVKGMEPCLTEIDDIWDRPYDRQDGQEQRMQDYLEWEVQLMDQAVRDGTVEFHC